MPSPLLVDALLLLLDVLVTRRAQVWAVRAGVVLLVAASFAYVLYRTWEREEVLDAPVGGLSGATSPSTPRSETREKVSVPGGQGDTIAIEHDAHRVVRRDTAGNLIWATPLDGYLGLVRPPHLLTDAERAYVTHEDGVTALDARTGAVVWHTTGPADRMLLTGGLLLATERGIGEQITKSGRWVTARDTKTGMEVFRVALPLKDFDPLPIEDAAGLILVQKNESPGGAAMALLLDHAGKVRHRFDHEVVATRLWAGGDRVFLTSRAVVRVTDGGEARWSAPFENPEWPAAGGLVPVPGGGLVAFLYCPIGDSGVQVLRLDPNTGGRLWETWCASLRVTHSEYSHTAAVVVMEDRLRVTSEASKGTFVEVLDLKTGRQLSRERRDP